MTIDRAVVNLESVFEYGQAYVALSRLRSLEGLTLYGFTPATVRAHPRVLQFYEEVNEAQARMERELLGHGKPDASTQTKPLERAASASLAAAPERIVRAGPGCADSPMEKPQRPKEAQQAGVKRFFLVDDDSDSDKES